MHGHKPGRGVRIDAEIQAEEHEQVSKMKKLQDVSGPD